MAGANKILKEGQVLFRAGDQSDGMYLIRKGELRVYLEQDGKEVVLANIPAGGMIGEMSLFDKQPRSASVKATQPTEVTHITTDDFSKLMRQIPKWFVGLMSSLSSRLRDTNERLKRLENLGTSGQPLQTVNRMLNILLLVWHKDGTKEGREFVVARKNVEDTMVQLFDEDPVKVKAFFEVLVKLEYVSISKDAYNNVLFATANKGALSQLSRFVLDHARSKPKSPCLSEPCLDMLMVLKTMVEANPYDTVTVSFTELMAEGKRQSKNTSGWEAALAELKDGGDALKLVKTSDGVGFRTTKKDIGPFVRTHQTIAAFFKANLT